MRAVENVPISVSYLDLTLDNCYEADILVEDCVVMEVKAVEEIHPAHVSQLVSYPKALDLPLGYVVNFNAAYLSHGLRRVVHPSYLSRPSSFVPSS